MKQSDIHWSATTLNRWKLGKKWASENIWVTRGQNISKTASLVGCMQWLVPTKNGVRKDNQRTGDRVMGTQGSLMHVGS